jgi:glycosyltransferase involved in cell wall biosynthesis
VHNGLDPYRFQRSSRTPVTHHHASNDRAEATFRLAYVGRIDQKKGIEAALAVTRLLSTEFAVSLSIVGGPTDGTGTSGREYYEQLKRRSETNVRWIGRADNPFEFLEGVDILLVPSNWGEPFGLVAAEAMRVGIVPVVFRDGGLPEVLGVALLHNVVNTTVEDLADQVRRLRNDPDLLEASRKLGYERADSLSADQMGSQIDTVLRSLSLPKN